MKEIFEKLNKILNEAEERYSEVERKPIETEKDYRESFDKYQEELSKYDAIKNKQIDRQNEIDGMVDKLKEEIQSAEKNLDFDKIDKNNIKIEKLEKEKLQIISNISLVENKMKVSLRDCAKELDDKAYEYQTECLNRHVELADIARALLYDFKEMETQLHNTNAANERFKVEELRREISKYL